MSLNPFLLTAALVATTLVSHAQHAPGPTTVATQTREMATRLHLNEGQYVRMLAANRTRFTRQQQIEHATKGDADARKAQLAELQSQYEQECSRILSPAQLSQVQQEHAPQQPTAIANGNG